MTGQPYEGDAGVSRAALYETVEAADLHSWLEPWLPEAPALVLDVGAGSGRDAAWLANAGHEVVAVEPSATMLSEARRRHPQSTISWIRDSLPALERVYRQAFAFDLVLLSAVWMHVRPEHRQRAFRKLIGLLKPGGRLAITFPQGTTDRARGQHPARVEEIESLARRHGAFLAFQDQDADRLGRTGLVWARLLVHLPDDGTGALPLLRHVILNDAKSSTYKLGLLRAIARASDGALGMAAPADRDVSIPLGLVALNWLRLYRPLVDGGFPQRPKNRGPDGLGFAGKGWRRIGDLNPPELRVGALLSGKRAAGLHQALAEVARTIARMPATHTTWPGSADPIFRAVPSAAGRPPSRILIDRDYLARFGELRVPLHLWRALSRYSCWIEPAVTAEWIRLMDGYAVGQKRSLDRADLARAMTWSEPSRDVHASRSRALELAGQGALYCVWSGRRLREASFDIDHCIPWAAWPCDDLWNLLPSASAVNQQKRDRLPSAGALAASRERILDWWESAYVRREEMKERFFIEARSSLPLFDEPEAKVEVLFDGLGARRQSLVTDQRVDEWAPRT
ncbi:MAG: class I SAM-dependent methyltransferase [Alphaproteobacteria bacterium]|nr:class I SAM-dependent methyltransferase [Alphaproteobacteria bacterium]